MHKVVRHVAREQHFSVGFCAKKLLELPQSPQNHTIS